MRNPLKTAEEILSQEAATGKWRGTLKPRPFRCDSISYYIDTPNSDKFILSITVRANQHTEHYDLLAHFVAAADILTCELHDIDACRWKIKFQTAHHAEPELSMGDLTITITQMDRLS